MWSATADCFRDVSAEEVPAGFRLGRSEKKSALAYEQRKPGTCSTARWAVAAGLTGLQPLQRSPLAGNSRHRLHGRIAPTGASIRDGPRRRRCLRICSLASAVGALNRHGASHGPRHPPLLDDQRLASIGEPVSRLSDRRKSEGGRLVNGDRGAFSHQAHGQACSVADVVTDRIWIADADRWHWILAGRQRADGKRAGNRIKTVPHSSPLVGSLAYRHRRTEAKGEPEKHEDAFRERGTAPVIAERAALSAFVQHG